MKQQSSSSAVKLYGSHDTHVQALHFSVRQQRAPQSDAFDARVWTRFLPASACPRTTPVLHTAGGTVEDSCACAQADAAAACDAHARTHGQQTI
eukprot:SAG11_NODE_18463_length_490_cov_1.056266_1_plen_93_part_10